MLIVNVYCKYYLHRSASNDGMPKYTYCTITHNFGICTDFKTIAIKDKVTILFHHGDMC